MNKIISSIHILLRRRHLACARWRWRISSYMRFSIDILLSFYKYLRKRLFQNIILEWLGSWKRARLTVAFACFIITVTAKLLTNFQRLTMILTLNGCHFTRGICTWIGWILESEKLFFTKFYSSYSNEFKITWFLLWMLYWSVRVRRNLQLLSS